MAKNNSFNTILVLLAVGLGLVGSVLGLINYQAIENSDNSSISSSNKPVPSISSYSYKEGQYNILEVDTEYNIPQMSFSFSSYSSSSIYISFTAYVRIASSPSQ